MSKKVAPPHYQNLVRDMGFDPDKVPVAEFKTEFEPWGLDERYPPTVGELMLEWDFWSKEGETDGGQGQGADDVGGGGEVVSGGPEDGGPVGDPGEAEVDQDAGGSPPVPA